MLMNSGLTLDFLPHLELLEASSESAVLAHDHQCPSLLYVQLQCTPMSVSCIFSPNPLIEFCASWLKAWGNPFFSLYLPAFHNGVMTELLPYVTIICLMHCFNTDGLCAGSPTVLKRIA